MEMKKITVYLSDDLKERVKAIALREKCSAARIIRDAISAALASRVAPRPRIPLSRIPLGDPTISERVDEVDLQ